MSPGEHALQCLIDGGLLLGFWGEWEKRVPTHAEMRWLVRDTLLTHLGAGLRVDLLLARVQLLHGAGSYHVPVDDPWQPPWRVGPGGRVLGVDGRFP